MIAKVFNNFDYFQKNYLFPTNTKECCQLIKYIFLNKCKIIHSLCISSHKINL